MKFYEAPETEIVKFSALDVVVTSDSLPTEETEDTSGASGGDF